VWLHLPFHDWAWPGPLVVAAVVYGPIIGFLSTQLLALYLLIASFFDVNVNELFAGQGIEDAKSFLRLHIAADGTLTIHPIGIDKICREWVADPDGAPHSSWLRPRSPSSYPTRGTSSSRSSSAAPPDAARPAVTAGARLAL
jgi:hypothetical protein